MLRSRLQSTMLCMTAKQGPGILRFFKDGNRYKMIGDPV